MTSTDHQLARMDSDAPRGYGVRGDVRKRLEAQHQAHPDPAVRELLARAWEAGHRACVCWRPGATPCPNPYRSAS